MKKPFKKSNDAPEVLNRKRGKRTDNSTEDRLARLESSVSFLFGLFLGSLAVKLFLSLFRFLLA